MLPLCPCCAGLPVFAVGNVAVDALAKLLSHLGAGPGGNCHVVVTDVREELVVYVNGKTCTLLALLWQLLPNKHDHEQKLKVLSACSQ